MGVSEHACKQQFAAVVEGIVTVINRFWSLSLCIGVNAEEIYNMVKQVIIFTCPVNRVYGLSSVSNVGSSCPDVMW